MPSPRKSYYYYGFEPTRPRATSELLLTYPALWVQRVFSPMVKPQPILRIPIDVSSTHIELRLLLFYNWEWKRSSQDSDENSYPSPSGIASNPVNQFARTLELIPGQIPLASSHTTWKSWSSCLLFPFPVLWWGSFLSECHMGTRLPFISSASVARLPADILTSSSPPDTTFLHS